MGLALAATSFDDVAWCRYSESARPVFQGLEGHDTYNDSPDLPHVIIAEAVKGDPRPRELKAFHRWAEEELLSHIAD